MKYSLTKAQAKELISGKLSHYFGVGVHEATDEQYYKAVALIVRELMHEGVRNRALGIHDNHIVDVDIKDSTAHNENYDQSLYELHSKMNRIY